MSEITERQTYSLLSASAVPASESAVLRFWPSPRWSVDLFLLSCRICFAFPLQASFQCHFILCLPAWQHGRSVINKSIRLPRRLTLTNGLDHTVACPTMPASRSQRPCFRTRLVACSDSVFLVLSPCRSCFSTRCPDSAIIHSLDCQQDANVPLHGTSIRGVPDAAFEGRSSCMGRYETDQIDSEPL